MKSSRMLPGAIVVGAVAIASMFAAAPASAATLPSGQKITIIDQDYDQFFNVDPSNAHATSVGTPPGLIDEFITGVDVDDTGHGYAVAVADFESEGGWIYEADANTGLLGEGWEVIIETGVDDTPADDCSAIDYTKGVILVACSVFGEQVATSYIGTLDISADEVALLTPLMTLIEEDFLYFTAIAQHPVNGTVYGFTGYYSDPESWIIPLDGEYPEYLDELDDVIVWGADFDRDGQLWLSTEPYSDEDRLANLSFYSLATFDFATEQPTIIDLFSAEPLTIRFPEAITVWGVPALAATGSAVPAAPAIAASLILLAGAILAAGTMVLRRRSVDA